MHKNGEERCITLGPRGPLLQRGVVVVLQSAQTLIVLLMQLGELISPFPCRWSLGKFFIVLVGLSVSWKFGFIIFCINLIFEDIHCTGPVVLLLGSPNWLWHMDNLWCLLKSSSTDWNEENENAWWSHVDP